MEDNRDNWQKICTAKETSLSKQRKTIEYHALLRLSMAVLTGAAFLSPHHGTDSRRDGIVDSTVGPAQNLPSDYPRVKFTDVTEQAGISFKHIQDTPPPHPPQDIG